MAAEMVMAWGDAGLEAVPADEVVTIKAFPLGEGNTVIPATIRCMAQKGGLIPTRLRAVYSPGTRRNPGRFSYVEFDCTPFARGGGALGYWNGCAVRNERDACDPLWATLTRAERNRIMRAASKVGIR